MVIGIYWKGKKLKKSASESVCVCGGGMVTDNSGYTLPMWHQWRQLPKGSSHASLRDTKHLRGTCLWGLMYFKKRNYTYYLSQEVPCCEILVKYVLSLFMS